MASFFRNIMLSCMFLAASSLAYAATYTYTGPAYPSGSISGSSFTPAMNISGQFTTSAPLPSSATVQLGSLATSWDFFDGVNHFTNANSIQLYNDPALFQVTTDASGTIISYTIAFQNPLPTNTVNQPMNLIFVNATQRQVYIGATCVSLSGAICNNASSSSNGVNDFTAGGSWSVSSGLSSIPTLSEWGVFFLIIIMVLFGLWQVRRREITLAK